MRFRTPALKLSRKQDRRLAVDDDFKRQSIVQLYQMAAQDPVLWNKRYAATKLAQMTRGIDVSQALNPEAPPAGYRGRRSSVSINVPFDKMPA
jgi:hypothetical protein